MSFSVSKRRSSSSFRFAACWARALLALAPAATRDVERLVFGELAALFAVVFAPLDLPVVDLKPEDFVLALVVLAPLAFRAPVPPEPLVLPLPVDFVALAIAFSPREECRTNTRCD